MSTASRGAKRKRPSDEQEGEDDNLSALSAQAPAHDETYYFPDGNCVIQVENTIFKVLVSFLQIRFSDSHPSRRCTSPYSYAKSPCSPSFLPLKGGASRWAPLLIRLSSTVTLQMSSAIFSGRCMHCKWSCGPFTVCFDRRFLRFSPHAKLTSSPGQVGTETTLSIVKVANIYSLKSVETHSCSELTRILSKKSFSFDAEDLTHRELVTFAIRLGIRSERHELVNVACEKLRRSSSDPHLQFTLRLCEELKRTQSPESRSDCIRRLMGFSYYHAMFRDQAFWDSAGLSQDTVQCVLRGYHRIMKDWSAMQESSAPDFAHSEDGRRRERCQASWRNFWGIHFANQNTKRIRPGDIDEIYHLATMRFDQHCTLGRSIDELRLGCTAHHFFGSKLLWVMGAKDLRRKFYSKGGRNSRPVEEIIILLEVNPQYTRI